MKRKFIGILVKFKSQPSKGPSAQVSTSLVGEWSAQNTPVLYITPEKITEREQCFFASGWSPNLSQDRWDFFENVEIQALYNRFPHNQSAGKFTPLLRKLNAASFPIGNPVIFQDLVRDKVKTNQILQNAKLPIPDFVTKKAQFLQKLSEWKIAYLKPRYGAFGEGIYQLKQQGEQVWFSGSHSNEQTLFTTEQSKAKLEEITAGTDYFLQQAIQPPQEWLQGFSIRALLQRESLGTWHNAPRVARSSQNDPIANVARGAEATPWQDFLKQRWTSVEGKKLQAKLQHLEQKTAKALLKALPENSQKGVIEMGIDWIVDPNGQAWLLEINGFPQGKLEKLAELKPGKYQKQIRKAHWFPLQYLENWSIQRRTISISSFSKKAYKENER